MRLDPEWLSSKARLTRLYSLWKGALGTKVDTARERGTVERELRSRAHALHCVVCFLRHLPEAFSAPLLKPIVNSLLPPNTGLLAAVREGANAMQREYGPGFRPAFVLFRARFYELLGSLPSSTLSAKLLNVVMPLVVADLVDPNSTLASTCTALAPMLDPGDAPLCAKVGDVRASEPMRDVVSPLALASCDSFAELKGTVRAAAYAFTRSAFSPSNCSQLRLAAGHRVERGELRACSGNTALRLGFPLADFGGARAAARPPRHSRSQSGGESGEGAARRSLWPRQRTGIRISERGFLSRECVGSASWLTLAAAPQAV